MDKIKTSIKRRTSSIRQRRKQAPKNDTHGYVLRKDAEVSEYDPFAFILSEHNMATAITECLINNDPNGVVDILEHYLNASNKTDLLKKAHIPRSTMYQLLKNRNPTIKTLAKLIHAAQYPLQ